MELSLSCFKQREMLMRLKSSIHLLRCKQGGVRNLPPLLIIRNQFVVHQFEDTIGFHNATLKGLILLWWTCRYGTIRDRKITHTYNQVSEKEVFGNISSCPKSYIYKASVHQGLSRTAVHQNPVS